MDWKDVESTIANIAPTIAGTIGTIVGGGPIGSLASSGMSILLNALGLKSDAKPEEVVNAITTDPEARLKLMVAENQFKLDMEKQNTEKLRAELADISNARAREVEIVRLTGKRDVLQFGLAVLGVLGPISLVAYMVIRGLPSGMTPEAAAMVGAFIGIIIGEYKTIYQYFFGSSKGSALKSEFMEKQINGKK